MAGKEEEEEGVEITGQLIGAGSVLPLAIARLPSIAENAFVS